MLPVWCSWLPANRLSNPLILLPRGYIQFRVLLQVGCIAGSASTISLGFSDKNVDTSGVFYVYGLPAVIGGKLWLHRNQLSMAG